ncbi:hypothetical protein JCM10213_004868 [Rhodosporidiobolus nylandii]
MPLPYTHRQTDSTRSIALSPVTPYAYSETDPFLSPRLSQSQPGSPLLRPSSPRTPTALASPSHSPFSSPGLSDGPSHNGFFEHIAIPPQAKRARSRTWLLAAGGLLLFVSFVRLTSQGVSSDRIEHYSTKVNIAFSRVTEWGGSLVASSEQSGTGEPAADAIVEADPRVAGQEVDPLGEIRVTALPKAGEPPKAAGARYIGYLPHSGYHNQRIALQNALLLGKLLNRTVLVPPVWIGWPVSTQHYADLRESWLNIMLLNPSSFNLSSLSESSPLNPPADFASSTVDFPCPSCDADNSTLVAERTASAQAKRLKWLEMGYEVRPDGYPIVPGLTDEECKSYRPECRFTYHDTFLSWDFLVDLDRAKAVGVDVVDRWDVRERALEGLLGVTPDDVYVLEDRQAYDLRFTDRAASPAPLISNDPTPNHWNRDVSLATLQSYPQKVLLVGSLFGSDRVVASHAGQEADEWKEAFGRAMAFKNPWLLRPANAIAARLGGGGNYVGVHARVGDGEFARHARQNSEASWRRLVGEGLGVRSEVLEEMWERVSPQRLKADVTSATRGRALAAHQRRSEKAHVAKVKRSSSSLVERSPWAVVDDEYQLDLEPEQLQLGKRGLVDSAFDWLSTVVAVEPSSRLRNLTCRAPLHTEARFSAFNTPLYLATDSRSPETDANLRPFFDAFPCTTILSDFDRPDPARNDGVVVKSVDEMSRLVNELDGVPLGRLFLPFLEAIVAAKARLTVGTAHSTFSGFAEGHLHRAYWDGVDA